ncbi:MAG: helix-turn-helix transcriptional regulator [Clostridia bacterium]|nr:helix-turn-helix transcriptional regulator [Clostridia bacterium]MBP3651689.1 helix-turn-helix transcriptional regulator [Clostridia bacterium]
MIEDPNSIIITDKQREIVQSREQDFPYTAIEARLELYPGKSTSWHWHDHFEFGIVKSGALELFTQQGSVRIRPGQGYFLNSKVLHMNRAAQPEGCVCLHAQLFARELLSGTGLVSRRYVAPVENCVGLELVLLNEDDEASREIMAEINAAFDAAEGDEPGYELFVCAHLSAAWGRMFRMMEPAIREESGVSRENAVRAKQMLSFIHEKYQNPITVAEIAGAAGICERECFRCFSDILDATPMEYLNRHRIGMACRALVETSDSIGRIAEDCGFSNSSYFGKVFRAMMGMSPGSYRRAHT